MTLQNYARESMYRCNKLFVKKKINGITLANVSRAPRHLTYHFKMQDPSQLDRLLNTKLQESMALAYGVTSVSTYRDKDVVKQKIDLPEQYWNACNFSDTTQGGVGFGDDNIQIEFDYDVPQTLVAGTTGSGKTLATSALAIAAYRKSNESAFFAFADPHAEFTQFENFRNLARPIATDIPSIITTINWVYEVYTKRTASNIRDGHKLVLVLDEAEEVYSQCQAVLNGTDAMNQLVMLASGGRKYNVHLIVASQKPDENTLPRLLPNLNQRYVGAVTTAQISYNLTGHKGLRCHESRGKGQFVQVRGGGINQFQFGLVRESDFSALPRGFNELNATYVAGAGSTSKSDIVTDVPSFDESVTELKEEVEKQSGRPVKALKSEVLGIYIKANLQNVIVSPKKAKQHFKLTKYYHERYVKEAKIIADILRAK